MGRDNILRLLFLEKSPNDAEILLNVLRKGGHATRPRHISTLGELENALTERNWDLLLSAYKMDDLTALDALEMLAHSGHDIPCIVVGDHVDEEQVIDVLIAGGKDLIPRDQTRRLLLAVRRELHNLETRRSRRKWKRRFREVQRRYEDLLESAPDAIAYVTDGMHINVNPEYQRIFGFEEADELEGLPMMDLVATEDQVRFKEFIRLLIKQEQEGTQSIEVSGLQADGSQFDLKMDFSEARFEGEDCFQVVAQSGQPSAELEAKLHLASQRDQLTELYNHGYFLEALEEAVSDAVDRDERSVLFYIELDDFGKLRQDLGVAASDRLICDIAAVVDEHYEHYGDRAALARFADFTFTALVKERDPALARANAEILRRAVEHHIAEIDDRSVAVTCSIGVAPLNENLAGPEEALDNASGTCRKLRLEGGNAVALFEPKVVRKKKADDTSGLVDEIKAALSQNRLALLFQPVVSLHGETEEVYEIFLRANGESGHPLPTAQVFRVAEEAGIVTDLDAWVVENALTALAARRKAGYDTRFFIKLSDKAIMDEQMLLNINKALNANELSGEHLVVELSETAATTQLKYARAFAHGLKQIQCGAALDHFGSGLDSFKLLNHLEVDYLKIDGSYIRGLVENQEHQAAVRSIHDTAQAMGKKTIATSVEDANSLAILWISGVNFAQGDYVQEASEDMTYDFSSTD